MHINKIFKIIVFLLNTKMNIKCEKNNTSFYFRLNVVFKKRHKLRKLYKKKTFLIPI